VGQEDLVGAVDVGDRERGDGRAPALSSPCGLDFGAGTAAETAIAILALRAGRGGGRLTHGAGPIHGRSPVAATG
jgi:xanthine/CO dehydrogenase XdhC/CoxF family maturation factor